MLVEKWQMREEAVRRMEQLGIHQAQIDAFFNRGEIFFSVPPMGIQTSASDEEMADIKDFEQAHNKLVYLAIYSFVEGWNMVSYLYVDSDDKNWDDFQVYLNANRLYTYTVNLDEPARSEYGSIACWRTPIGGIVRLYAGKIA